MWRKSRVWQIVTVSSVLALAFPLVARGESERATSPALGSPSGGSEAEQAPERRRAPEQRAEATTDTAATEVDRTLNQRIRQALDSDTALAAVAEQIQLESDNGVVTLRGAVTTSEQKSEVAATVAQVAGVKKINNELQIAAK